MKKKLNMAPIEKDPILDDFFLSMKTKDLNRAVPEFPSRKKRKSRKLLIVSVGIAASFLLWVLIYTGSRYTGKLQNDQIIFMLNEDTHLGTTYFQIKESSSIDTWEPATQSLLDEL